MKKPCYLDIEQARAVLSEIGIDFNLRQMQRAAEKDAHGRRKLPFFIDPIDKKLKIDKSALIGAYVNRQVSAENQALSADFD